ncbi:plasminogen-like [Branchiostoma lanceolatum]|uniref:plasminogen-like n=1 Tax=Branchiostoma lanceolatum TaxID=7740 RepID=UPI003455D513
MACRLLVLILALQALHGLFLANGSSYPGYTLRDDTSYKVFTEAKSHYQAEQACEADGGHLVDIKTESLHNFILDMVREVNPYRDQDYWIGLNDKRTYNVWTWSDGTPLSGCGFSKWAPGEPNDGAGTGQDCGQLWAAVGLRWDDDFCSIRKRFICQIGPGENDACSGDGCRVANGGCAQICTSDGPNIICDCRIGYVLSDDWHNCAAWTDDLIAPKNKVYTKHCMFGRGATYRGTVSMTSTGLTCQRWDSQSPHPHDQTTRHPLAGLNENYCRNPDGEPRPWCYTTDPNVRWQYCTVPQCFNDCYIDDGASYRGAVNITSSGRACQRWDSQTPHPHTQTPTTYPSAGLDENFCRNPDGEAEPWCYTQDPYVRWEACVISKCDGKGITTTATSSEGIKVFPESCYFGDGATYRGKVSVSKDGIPCQRWNSQTPHQHDIPSRFPGTELNENYCRNPDGWDRPWCYTTDPNIRWQICDIPGCFSGDCYDDNGVSYRGKVNVTSSGLACQRWDSQTPHHHFNTTADIFPQAGLQDNYCRNPNRDVKPWCYTTDPLTRTEFCAVPTCGECLEMSSHFLYQNPFHPD